MVGKSAESDFVAFSDKESWFGARRQKSVMSQPVKTSADSSLNEDEAQKNEDLKTPIQLLQEYGTQTGKLPVYMLERAEGMAHQPSFLFSVKVGEVIWEGQGPSKKAAKHMAAKAALSSLKLECEALKFDSNDVAAQSHFPANSVGLLQELALQRGWHFPEYTIALESGPPHRREFTVTCRLESLTERAAGNSKKSAKRAAAGKMIAKLQSLSGSSEITWSPKPSVRLEDLRNSSAERICSLRRNPLSIPNTDYIQLLLELSKEQGFEVTYFNIDELTVNGQYQCLAELSTTPVTVCHGSGISCSNAHNAAAHGALQYIKIMASTSK